MKILCTHNDGGVGKTTLAVHAVGALSSQIGRILLIDCDDQTDSWQFYVDRIPEKGKPDFQSAGKYDEISVAYNPDRESIKKMTKPEQYNHIVLDIDSPLANTVQVILQDNPNLILVPVNLSQRAKALRNLPRTLQVIANMESNMGFTPIVKIVPLGVERERLLQVVEKAENKPRKCSVAEEMSNLQDEMQKAIYEDRKYIWNYNGYEYLKDYFNKLLGI
ncbi:AAA family ATPase [Lyngbya sp. PCC 8106]|uniref:AAA family ATPase n=1 Tax=Lyngbya sp. (strain PCC 8106) TaxID=313612 RepID=UPI0000EA9712|nr:AAA family ATPase [Lyngbya sp. PCC 8106]EAW35625.1 hypothetical protein L8106_08151 [Lyngbya sp. PCC 8106]